MEKLLESLINETQSSRLVEGIDGYMYIKPAYKDSYYAFNDLPAGLGYISQALDDNNIDNMIFDMYLSKKV